MSLFALSLSHRTTDLDTLARVSLPAESATKICHSLTEAEHISEATVLSTCNRVEVYADVDRFHGGLDAVVRTLAAVSGMPEATLQESCAIYYDEAVVAHAFSVAAGLDSVVPGENQILGQFREALALGQAAGTVGSALNSVFQQGIRVGKRVRTETEIGRAGRSLVDAAFAQLTAHGPLVGSNVLVIGAGQMASIAARTAREAGAGLTIVNRTASRAARLAAQVAGTARPWDEWRSALHQADVVVCCTGAAGTLITADDLTGTRVGALLDLAMPPDIDPAVADLPGRRLINLEVLREAALRAGESDDLAAARQLVSDEVSAYLAARHAKTVTPTVVALRSMADDVVAAELKRLDARLPDLDEDARAELQLAVHRVAHKLLHSPTVRVQEYAADDEIDYAAALRALFALDPQDVAAVMSSEVGR